MCPHYRNLVDTRFEHVSERMWREGVECTVYIQGFNMRRDHLKSMCPHAFFPHVVLLMVEVSVLTLFLHVDGASPLGW